jgi:hypothetical protein
MSGTFLSMNVTTGTQNKNNCSCVLHEIPARQHLMAIFFFRVFSIIHSDASFLWRNNDTIVFIGLKKS